MQAGLKGVSLFVTGVIIGITPLAVTFLAPVIGYLVSHLCVAIVVVNLKFAWSPYVAELGHSFPESQYQRP